MIPGDGAFRGIDRRSPRGPVDFGSLGFGDMIEIVDGGVDAWFERFRGNPGFDTIARVVSGLGDHGLLWAVSTAWRARRPGSRRNRAVRALAIAGAESSAVNAILKAVIGRARPEREDLRLGDNIIPLREPTTSSFPSGHTLAAFCAATVLSEGDDHLGNTLLFASAGVIGVSRIHLGAHHASDVVGGMAIGVMLGLAGRRLV